MFGGAVLSRILLKYRFHAKTLLRSVREKITVRLVKWSSSLTKKANIIYIKQPGRNGFLR